MSYQEPEKLKDLPYTVIGHSSADSNGNHSITLAAEGIIELAKRIKPGDMVIIRNWSDITNEGQTKRHYQRISVRRKEQ